MAKKKEAEQANQTPLKQTTQQTPTAFDKYRELKYIGIWVAIIGGSATLLSQLKVETSIIVLLLIIIALLISSYLKDKEIEHLKEQ
jgi:hypothetical protein